MIRIDYKKSYKQLTLNEELMGSISQVTMYAQN